MSNEIRDVSDETRLRQGYDGQGCGRPQIQRVKVIRLLGIPSYAKAMDGKHGGVARAALIPANE